MRAHVAEVGWHARADAIEEQRFVARELPSKSVMRSVALTLCTSQRVPQPRPLDRLEEPLRRESAVGGDGLSQCCSSDLW